MQDLAGKVVMITGAAGNLGTAATEAFRETGAKLALVDHNGDKLQKRYSYLTSSSEVYLSPSVDLTREEEVMTLTQEVMDVFGRIDILVNITGGYRGGTPLHETSAETLSYLIDLNVLTAFNTSKAVIPHMLNQRDGSIINIAARGALKGAAKMGPYSASKSAVIRLTESTAAELKLEGIRVNCILPGTIDTPNNRENMPDADFSRWVPPEALADVILFLASEQSRAITGASIPVYGRG
ncbi:MAG: SDR family NAD(P)-dependent oxidoreductase [Anaerolineales bacterium]|nr:SDR family NAD(P)-dependent oxidoreductase [Anaerolineales bacterium]